MIWWSNNDDDDVDDDDGDDDDDDVAAMQFYRRTPNVAGEMEEMCAEGKKTTPLSASRDASSAVADVVDGKAEEAATDYVDGRPTTLMELFADPALRHPLFIACALVTVQQFSGINAVRRITIITISTGSHSNGTSITSRSIR